MSGPLFKGAEAHYVAAPVWHPDGRRLAFTTMRKGDFDTYRKDLNAATPPEALLVTDGDDILGAFAPDGLTAIVRLSEPNGTYPMKTMTLAPRGQPKPLTTQDGNHPAISPDGKHVAFVSDRAGAEEIYVMPMAGGVANRISTRGGQAVAWSADGRELYYARPPEIIAVSLRRDGDVIRPAGERVWSRIEGSNPEDIFARGPDGRILIGLPPQATELRQIRVVIGFGAEIEEKLKKR